MKKFVVCALLFALLTFSFVGCSSSPSHFSGEWQFAEIGNVEIVPDPAEGVMDLLKEIYGAQDEAGIVAGALDKFVEEQTFDSCYIRFEKNRVYTYDPAMDREATWVFYQTGENEGFISFFTELDANEGNPDPVICPALVYNPNNQVMSITLNYSEFMVTLEMTR